MIRLVDSLIGYTAVILLLASTLYLFGVNTEAMLASAGIVSIAVGMGARDLVTDILAGVFMLLEDSLHVGDTVQVGAWEGRVTDMGIRTTRITNDRGEVKILNNSHNSDVINKNCVEQAVSADPAAENAPRETDSVKLPRKGAAAPKNK